MAVGDRERVSHLLRRLSVGTQVAALAGVNDVDAARAAALDLSAPAPVPLDLPVPTGRPTARDIAEIVEPITWWIDQMRSGRRMIEERLVWFWHDHFATSVAKVRSPYLMYRQHVTIRTHAAGSFAELLHAMAKDPAMLVWLDGMTNAVRNSNENFGRECLELFTLGRDGGYTQADVVAASHASTGWIVNLPGRRFASSSLAPFDAVLVPRRHDGSVKTLLGRTGPFDLDGALDVMLEHPATARHVAGKLYNELVGLDPDDATLTRLADGFRRDYAVLPLVEAIVADPVFVSDQAVRAKARTPLEKLVGILQAAPAAPIDLGRVRVKGKGGAPGQQGVGQALRTLGYVPFAPPNVGGFPKGPRLLGPHQLVHTFDLLAAVDQSAVSSVDAVDALLARFGLFDVTDRSRQVVAREQDPARRLALVVGSPEFALT